jgi:hypothetical protein
MGRALRASASAVHEAALQDRAAAAAAAAESVAVGGGGQGDCVEMEGCCSDNPVCASWAVESAGWWRRLREAGEGKKVAAVREGEGDAEADRERLAWVKERAGLRVLEGKEGGDMSAGSVSEDGVEVQRTDGSGPWRVETCWWCGRNVLTRDGRIKRWKIETWDVWW